MIFTNIYLSFFIFFINKLDFAIPNILFPNHPNCNYTEDQLIKDNTTRNINAAKIILFPSNINLNLIQINWSDDPFKTELDQLCGYTLFWHNKSVNEYKDHHFKEMTSNERSLVIKNLKPGTTYNFYLKMFFEDYHSIYSWNHEFTTSGYGPDRPCKCHINGTMKNTICDIKTGECQCIDGITGLNCDSCIDENTFFNNISCTPCDCKIDKSKTGKCYQSFDKKGYKCICTDGVSGDDCNQCNHGYYMSNFSCTKCNCSNNEDKSALEICDNSGKCLSCLNNTIGNHCEKCIDGYIRDNQNSPCRLMLPQYSTVIIILIILCIAGFCILITIFTYKKCSYMRRESSGCFTKMRHDQINFATLVEEPDDSLAPDRIYSI